MDIKHVESVVLESFQTVPMEPVHQLRNQALQQRLILQELKHQLLRSQNTHVMSVVGLSTIGGVIQAKIPMEVSVVLTAV